MPIANVVGTVAGSAAAAQLAVAPNGTSLVPCADVQAAIVTSIKVGVEPTRALYSHMPPAKQHLGAFCATSDSLP